MTNRIKLQAEAPEDLAGKRLDQVAAALFPDFSRGRLQQWIRDGALTLDGSAAKPTAKVRGGQALALDAEPEVTTEAQPEDIPLDVLHADEDVIVLNKPAGLVVHPAPGNREGTLLNALLHFDPALETLPRAGLVHRLDKDTSGVMVVARSLRAHTSLVDQLQSRTMSREYRAVAIGELISGGTVDAPIGRHPVNRKKMAVVHNGKPAVTHFRILERFAGFTYLQVALETGRTHQIRVHLASEGFSLLGDPVYGGRSQRRGKRAPDSQELVAVLGAFQRQALHAYRLRFQHPADQQDRTFEAPLPADLNELLLALRKYAPASQ